MASNQDFLSAMGENWVERTEPRHVSIVCFHEGVRNSVAQADEIEPRVWWVARVLVHRDHRGKGIGKRLVERMLHHCRMGSEVQSPQCVEVRVVPGGYDNDTERQRGFYAACGFKPTDDGDLVWRSSC